MSIRRWIILLLLAVVSIFSTRSESLAVSADPVLHTMSQPDGTTFKARQWGDENSHGWQTEDGHSIVFDKAVNKWTYAVLDANGSLASSGAAVGIDSLPDVPEGLRPAGQVIQKKMLTREIQAMQAIKPRTSSPSGLVGTLSVPSTGTSNIPVILVNFNDTAATYTAADFNALLFGTGNNSMKDYYSEVSYGNFTVSAGPGGIIGWYTAGNTHDDYGENVPCPSDPGGCDRDPAGLVADAVLQADAAGFNFAPYDQDGDCYVDVVNIIHQGAGAESSGNSNDIWSHRWNLNDVGLGEITTSVPCTRGGFIKVNDYIIGPEKLAGQMSTIGVFAHEYGHALGLPDLYDTDKSSFGVGDWSLMANGEWNKISRDGDRPAHMDAWSKYFLGWVTPTLVTGTLTSESIQQAETNADVYKIRSGTPLLGEYFLVENRQKTGFDAGLPQAGLLIWHIDGNTIGRKTTTNKVNNDECLSLSGSSCGIKHYGVALVQADAQLNLEKNNNKGDAGDPYPGSSNNTSFTSASIPNSSLYNGMTCGANITNISASGATMTATLSTSPCMVLSDGEIHSKVIDADGTLWSWGYNGRGQVGDGTVTQRLSPVQVGAGSNWVSVSAGGWHNAAVKSDGSLWGWGSNSFGEAGINVIGGPETCNTYPCVRTPYRIGSDNNWRFVSAQAYNSLAIKSDGTLWVWGQGFFGQFGNGTSNTNSFIPLKVGDDTDWVSATTGPFNMAIKSNGTLWAWGANFYGMLGIGNNTGPQTCGTGACSTAPLQVGTDTDWVSFSASTSYTLALKSDGTLWAWGANNYGRLGDGTETDRYAPVQIGNDNDWVSVSTGFGHSLAIKSNGTLWAWGSNLSGALGTGTYTGPETCGVSNDPCSRTPVQVGTDNNWVSVSAGAYHSIALKSNWTLWAWGTNPVGDGTSNNSNVPVQIFLSNLALDVSRTGSGNGVITSNPAGIYCGNDCYEIYDYNTVVTLSAVADTGSTFIGWSGACTGTGDCVVTMDAAKSVTAEFTLNAYDLTVSKTGTGSGTVTSIPAGIDCGAACSET